MDVAAAVASGDVKALRQLHLAKPGCLLKTDKRGITTAHISVSAGQMESLHFIGEQHPELLSQPDVFGATPAHVAAHGGCEGAARYLQLMVPQTVRTENRDGALPSHWAATAGQLQVFKVWLESGAKDVFVARQRKNLVTPAMVAAYNGHMGILEFLHHECGDNVFVAVDSSGATPAHYAARGDQEAALKYILKLAPGTKKALDNDNKTPQDLARVAAVQAGCAPWWRNGWCAC